MDSKKHVLQRSIDAFGESYIVDLFFEESGELTKALLKARRYGLNSDRLAAIVDEIADVSICLEYLKMIYYCDSSVEDRVDFKVKRIAQRTAEKIAEERKIKENEKV